MTHISQFQMEQLEKFTSSFRDLKVNLTFSSPKFKRVKLLQSTNPQETFDVYKPLQELKDEDLVSESTFNEEVKIEEPPISSIYESADALIKEEPSVDSIDEVLQGKENLTFFENSFDSLYPKMNKKTLIKIKREQLKTGDTSVQEEKLEERRKNEAYINDFLGEINEEEYETLTGTGILQKRSSNIINNDGYYDLSMPYDINTHRKRTLSTKYFAFLGLGILAMIVLIVILINMLF